MGQREGKKMTTPIDILKQITGFFKEDRSITCDKCNKITALGGRYYNSWPWDSVLFESEYICDKCKKALDIKQSIKDAKSDKKAFQRQSKWIKQRDKLLRARK